TGTATAEPTTAAPATQTATSLPTATIPACVGDCNGDGAVTIDELIRAVTALLDDRPPADCPAIDVNGDQQVTVDELVRAVTRALNGCGSQASSARARI